jgi:MSHA pilin protein MshC
MKNNGFTVIELVMVIVLIGIITVFAAPRMLDVTGTKASSFRDKLKADIRYAQNLAMTRNSRTRVYFNGTGPAPAQGYAVGIDSSAANDCSAFVLAVDPAGTTMLVTLNAGTYAGITVVPAPPIMTCLEYDSLGRPYACGAGACSVVPMAAAMTMDVNGDATMRVSVTTQTGAVN